MKVYLVMATYGGWENSWENGSRVEVFDNKSKAARRMKKMVETTIAEELAYGRRFKETIRTDDNIAIAWQSMYVDFEVIEKNVE